VLLFATVLGAALLAVEPTPPTAQLPPQLPAEAPAGGADEADAAKEPEGGAGVSPVELIPRVELREAYSKLVGGVSIHDTTAEIDIQFLRRILLRYQVPARLVETPAGQVSGIGDLQVSLIGIVASNARTVGAVVAGTVLDTATQPTLGAGKQQLVLGGAAGFKPYRWWLAYGVAQEQFSVGGNSARSDVNQLATDFGSILFGRQYNWLKLDLNTTVDFTGSSVGRAYGLGEVGSLVVGRVGLFARAGTQLVGPAWSTIRWRRACDIFFGSKRLGPSPIDRHPSAAPATGCGDGWCRRLPARASCARRSPLRAGAR
jgi:hypothetical protein